MPAPPSLTVHLRSQDEPTDLLSWLPEPTGVLGWLSGDEGMVGWGSAACLRPVGATRFAQAQHWWDEVTARATVHDPDGLDSRGGLVAMVKLAYADDSDASCLIVPEVLVGRRRGRGWIATTTGPGQPIRARPSRDRPVRPITAPTDLHYRPGTVSPAAHRAVVAAATERIRTGTVEKVVLARDLRAESSTVFDQRWILARLAGLYPSCWTFAVDGLVGASPELLLRVEQDRFSVLVLAGTGWPGVDGSGVDGSGADPSALLASSKERAEHALAVESVVATLAPLSTELSVPPAPVVLRLPNVIHLATRVRGRLAPPVPAPLELIGRLHPTAAVCGTPLDAAQRAIADLEQLDRGGYLGPVGWLDSHGRAEFVIALRCAAVTGASARLFAGGGIVAGSMPEREDAEVEAKLDAFRAALGGASGQSARFDRPSSRSPARAVTSSRVRPG